jgi:hypothetical protein
MRNKLEDLFTMNMIKVGNFTCLICLLSQSERNQFFIFEPIQPAHKVEANGYDTANIYSILQCNGVKVQM